jgi:DNA-binding transcriptional regulator LsrR (DeoR family)
MARQSDAETTRLDDAARAGWLYYVAGNTQDEIARKLGISRQSAQRLVSLAMSERLIKVRLDHPIARCMELAAGLTQRFGLSLCEVAPSDPTSPSITIGVAETAAAEMERWLRRPEPTIMAVGTGRTLRAVADQLTTMECPQHRVVALVGNTKADGSATFYDAVVRISDRVKAPYYPMPLPVVARNREERDLFTGQSSVENLRALIARADIRFVGVGLIGSPEAALLVDGFVTEAENAELRAAGAVGEITGWAFDGEGRLIEGLTNDRVTSLPLDPASPIPVVAVGMGRPRRTAILAALRGRLVSGLITDEATAEYLLKSRA